MIFFEIRVLFSKRNKNEQKTIFGSNEFKSSKLNTISNEIDTNLWFFCEKFPDYKKQIIILEKSFKNSDLDYNDIAPLLKKIEETLNKENLDEECLSYTENMDDLEKYEFFNNPLVVKRRKSSSLIDF